MQIKKNTLKLFKTNPEALEISKVLIPKKIMIFIEVTKVIIEVLNK